MTNKAQTTFPSTIHPPELEETKIGHQTYEQSFCTLSKQPLIKIISSLNDMRLLEQPCGLGAVE